MPDVLKSRPASYWVTVAAVVTVAVVAAVISYSHITDIALAAGEDWRSYLIPWTFDGVVLAASMTMMIRRARHLAYGWLPISALGFGVVGSIAANVANAVTRSQTILGNHGIAVMLAGFVPLAFLACFHMLLGQHALVTIRPDVELPAPHPEIGEHVGQAGLSQLGLSKSGVLGGPEGQQVTHSPALNPATWPAVSTARGGWPANGDPVTPGPLPQWKVWRLDVEGKDPVNATQHSPELSLSAVQPGNGLHDAGVGNGRNVLGVGLPPLAELEGGRGQSNGHSSPNSSASTDPGIPEGKSMVTTTSEPSARIGTTPGTPVTSDSDTVSSAAASVPSAMPDDVSRYLVDELYNLAAEDGLTLQELLSMGRVSGSQPPATGTQPGTARRSSPTSAGSAGPGGTPRKANGLAADPTPTTPPPAPPSPAQPGTGPGPGHLPSGTQPLTTSQILAYLDNHQGITVKQAASDLQVSESTIYRAKRARTQGGERS